MRRRFLRRARRRRRGQHQQRHRFRCCCCCCNRRGDDALGRDASGPRRAGAGRRGGPVGRVSRAPIELSCVKYIREKEKHVAPTLPSVSVIFSFLFTLEEKKTKEEDSKPPSFPLQLQNAAMVAPVVDVTTAAELDAALASAPVVRAEVLKNQGRGMRERADAKRPMDGDHRSHACCLLSLSQPQPRKKKT